MTFLRLEYNGSKCNSVIRSFIELCFTLCVAAQIQIDYTN